MPSNGNGTAIAKAPQMPAQAQQPPYAFPPRARKGNAASCIAATLFLIFIVAVLLLVFFLIFRARDPALSVVALQVPSFVAGNGNGNVSSLSVRIIFQVRNGNRGSFDYYDSTVSLEYFAKEVSSLALPAGKVAPGKSVEVHTLLISEQPFAVQPGSAILPMQIRIRMAGRVNVLSVFTHHVEVQSHCLRLLSARNGALLSYRCSPSS